MTGTLHNDQYTFFIISRSFLLIMRNVSDNIYRDNQNTHFLFNNYFFVKCAVCEIVWNKYFTSGQATDDNMAHAHCLLDA